MCGIEASPSDGRRPLGSQQVAVLRAQNACSSMQFGMILQNVVVPSTAIAVQMQAYHNLYAAVSQSLGIPPPNSELLLMYEATEMEMLKEGFSDDARLKMIIVLCGGDGNRVRMQLLSDSADSLPQSTSISNCDVEFFIHNEQSNMLVDINSSGDNLLMWSHHGGANQRFTMHCGLIRASHSGLVVTCGADGELLQTLSTGADNQLWSFDASSGAIRGFQGRCFSIDASEGGVKEGSAVFARPFVGAAWQRFALVPSISVEHASSSQAVTVCAPSATAPATASAISKAAAGGGGAAAASAVAPMSCPPASPTIAPAASPTLFQLELPPSSTPALQRLRALLVQARDECDRISPAQRIEMTCEISALQSQIPSEYHSQLFELLRLLASNSRIQDKNPRPPYFVCNAAAPTPAVTPMNEFFSDLQVPGLSTYNVIATNIACVRMPQSSLSHMHADVRQLARSFHPAMLDVFFVVVDGRVLQDNITANRPINIIPHRWVHDHLRHGGHAASRVRMVIKSPLGVSPSHHQGHAVPFTNEGLVSTALEVYSHENDHGPIPTVPQADGAPAAPVFVRERVALYSPNNCWFHIIPGSPFASFTLCVFAHEGRACICTMLVLIDFEDAFCKHVVTALRSAPSLPSLHHLVHAFEEAVAAVRASTHSIAAKGHELLASSALAVPADQDPLLARSMARFNLLKLLPANVRNNVFHFAWVVKGRPQNVHLDFGRMSIYCSRELDADQHCTMAQVLQCIQLSADELVHNLDALVPQLRSVAPLPFDLSHDSIAAAQRMLAAARRVFEDPLPPVHVLLQDLDKHHVDAISYHTWRHMGHVEGDRAGEAELFRESGSPLLKFQALVDAAMRFVYIAQHECSRGSGGAQQGSSQHVAACELDTRVAVAGSSSNSSSSEAAAGPVTSSSPQQSPEGTSRLMRTHATSDVASRNVAETSDAHVETSDVTNSLIK